MIRAYEGNLMINPRHVVALYVQQDTDSHEWWVMAGVRGNPDLVLMGVFNNAIDADEGMERLAEKITKANLGVKE
jgi:hypothetical protein